MSDIHQHDWKPLEGEVAQYVCVCTAHGRKGKDGVIRAYTNSTRRQRGVPARPASGISSNAPGGRRIGDYKRFQ